MVLRGPMYGIFGQDLKVGNYVNLFVGVVGMIGVVAKQKRTGVSAKDLIRLVEKQGYRCALTGRELAPDCSQVDHVVALSKGGEHAVDNLQVTHSEVNAAKGSMGNSEFIQMCRDVVAWVDRDK